MTVLLLAEDSDDFIANAPNGWRVHRLAGDHGCIEPCICRTTLMAANGIQVNMTPSHPGDSEMALRIEKAFGASMDMRARDIDLLAVGLEDQVAIRD